MQCQRCNNNATSWDSRARELNDDEWLKNKKNTNGSIQIHFDAYKATRKINSGRVNRDGGRRLQCHCHKHCVYPLLALARAKFNSLPYCFSAPWAPSSVHLLKCTRKMQWIECPIPKIRKTQPKYKKNEHTHTASAFHSSVEYSFIYLIFVLFGLSWLFLLRQLAEASAAPVPHPVTLQRQYRIWIHDNVVCPWTNFFLVRRKKVD